MRARLPGRDPRSERITVSRSSLTVSCRSGTALGAPVVPDVNWMMASPAGTERDSAACNRSSANGPFAMEIISSCRTRSARSGHAMTACTPVACTARASSAAGARGFRGTNAADAPHTPNQAAIVSGSLGDSTPTARPEHSARNSAVAISRASVCNASRVVGVALAYATMSSRSPSSRSTASVDSVLTTRSRRAAGGPRSAVGGPPSSGSAAHPP